MRLYRGTGTGGFFATTTTIDATWGNTARTFAMGDFNNDGHPDLGRTTNNGAMEFAAGTGTGRFQSVTTIGTGWERYNAIISGLDFDGDGKIDVIARDLSGNVDLYRGNGNGGWATGNAQRIATGWGGFTAIFNAGNFDGAGGSDILVRRADGALVLYSTSGNGAFLQPRVIDSGWSIFTTLLSPGDFDGDRIPDILARRSDGRLYLYSGNGRGEIKNQYRLVDSGWNTMWWLM